MAFAQVERLILIFLCILLVHMFLVCFVLVLQKNIYLQAGMMPGGHAKGFLYLKQFWPFYIGNFTCNFYENVPLASLVWCKQRFSLGCFEKQISWKNANMTATISSKAQRNFGSILTKYAEGLGRHFSIQCSFVLHVFFPNYGLCVFLANKISFPLNSEKECYGKLLGR